MLRSVVSRYYVEGTSLAFGQLSSTVMPRRPVPLERAFLILLVDGFMQHIEYFVVRVR